MDGVIQRLNKERYFGFIRDKSGNEYFFHASALKNISFSMLEVGREVMFEDADGVKGLRAEDIYV